MKFWNKKLRRCLLIKLQIKHSRHDKIFHHPLPEILKKVDKNESFLFELMLCEVLFLLNHVRYSKEQIETNQFLNINVMMCIMWTLDKAELS